MRWVIGIRWRVLLVDINTGRVAQTTDIHTHTHTNTHTQTHTQTHTSCSSDYKHRPIYPWEYPNNWSKVLYYVCGISLNIQFLYSHVYTMCHLVVHDFVHIPESV